MNVNRRTELLIKLAKKKNNMPNEPFDKKDSSCSTGSVNVAAPSNETWAIVSGNESNNLIALDRSIEKPNSSTNILENENEERQLCCTEPEEQQSSTSNNIHFSDNLFTNCAMFADSFDDENPDPDDPLWRGDLHNSTTSQDKMSSGDSDDDSDRDPSYDPEDDGRNKILKICQKRKVRNIQKSAKLMETSSEGTETEEQSENINIDFLNSPPEKKKRGRKRSLRKEEWIKNKSKKLKNSGQSYVSCSKSKKEFPEKTLKPPCNDNCRLKCSTVISQEERQEIFSKSLETFNSLDLHRDYVQQCKIGCNATYVTENNKLTMTDIKIVRVEKTTPFTLQYKTSFSEEEKYQIVPIQEKFGKEEEEGVSGRKRSARKMERKKLLTTCKGVSLNQMYKKRLSIPEKKKKDLLYLLNNKIIPGSYALFYDSL